MLLMEYGCSHLNIVSIFSKDVEPGKKVSQLQVLLSNRKMAYHLVRVKHAYENRLYHNKVENYDETNIVFDSEDVSVLDFLGTKRISYGDTYHLVEINSQFV